MTTIGIKNCHECPFSNSDNEWGKDMCNLQEGPIAEGFKQLPDNKVHDKCPLLTETYIIELHK